MLSDLPTVAQQGLGFDPTLSTFPFFCFALGTGVLQDGGSDWPSSMGRWGKGSSISGMEWWGEGSDPTGPRGQGSAGSVSGAWYDERHSPGERGGANAAVVIGLEKVSFHSNSKERQCRRMFKLPHNCTHPTG